MTMLMSTMKEKYADDGEEIEEIPRWRSRRKGVTDDGGESL